MNKKTILLYGRTGAGKSAQITELAEYVKKTLGLRTRVYTGDKGGSDVMAPYVDAGIIELVEMGDTDPWIFLHKATRGFVRDEKDGKWILNTARNKDVGLFAFESMRAYAEALKSDMERKGTQGINIGGGSNVNFSVTGDGETLKIVGGNMAQFGIVQSRITEEVWQSQKLDAPFILWTSSVSKDEDGLSAGKVLGPDVIGKALTGEVPRWFQLSFRIDVVPAQAGKPERHILYLGTSVDVNAGGATSLGNVRLPLGVDPLPASIEPASIVKALQMLDTARAQAAENIRKRLGGQ